MKFRCHCAHPQPKPPSPTRTPLLPLALLGVCYCRSMHLAKSIRVFRASALYRYSLPLPPSISSSLSRSSLTLRGLLITSLISLSGFLWGAIWPRWCVHKGVRRRRRAITVARVLLVFFFFFLFFCAALTHSGPLAPVWICHSRQMFRLTVRHSRS